jgi:hypothetical protein
VTRPLSPAAELRALTEDLRYHQGRVRLALAAARASAELCRALGAAMRRVKQQRKQGKKGRGMK